MVDWFTSGRRAHIIGVAGAGMSGIARVLIERGCIVSGSDAGQSSRLDSLAKIGVRIQQGHDAQFIGTVTPDVVIASSAIPDTNVELVAAMAAGVPVLSRPEATGALVRPWHVLAVGGTHGKTTTSSMLTLMLRTNRVDCSYLIGSELHATGVNAHQGTDPWAVVEADESDGTALLLRPRAVAITNVDADHLDRWGTYERMRQVFMSFVQGESVGEPPELVVTCHDDFGAASLAVRNGQQHVTYGEVTTADAVINITSQDVQGCEFTVRGSLHLRARTNVPGRHNVLNATAAALLAQHAGVRPDAIAQGLAEYRGARRRFELQGECGGVRVFDDYAHHPTAVAATIAAARSVTEGRVIVLCQPYRWYRTAMFVNEYATALSTADAVVLVDVFGPGEQPVAGAGASAIAERIHADATQVDYCPTKSDAVALLASMVRAGDVVMTLGGEDIRSSGTDLVQLLERSQ